jgi:DNA-binding ferritin-like protein
MIPMCFRSLIMAISNNRDNDQSQMATTEVDRLEERCWMTESAL